ncbi:DUF1684 domain-containing protein [Agrococcus sp. SGAir0287]|uniref:DUF1684 domain-containing protein n=1 Tax=Agrococcus sp. SGAir0287 TaxID=2070347 RepID=UPI0010CCF387|nr:DUF1684 domain-containing protein [Agrococcus sp. SGAir0287]QCR19417.1 DUF1684 domain-containing protein [Agrococcus sp. SGAir0287]
MSSEQDHAAFRRRREQSVRAAQGALALVTTAWIERPTTIDGVPGTWAPTPAGDGVALTATEADEITVDGRVVDGTVVVHPHDGMTPSRVRFDDTRTGYVIQRGRGVGVRIWDAESDAIARFEGFATYDHDPAWVVEGRFEPGSVEATVGRSQGGERVERMAGTVRATIQGHEVALLAMPDGDALQIVFADATTGDETYGVGRFLFVRPRRDGSVELDLNRAIVPPCAMSDQFDCPLPPAQNRLPFAIRAGEQRPRFADAAAA